MFWILKKKTRKNIKKRTYSFRGQFNTQLPKISTD